MYPCTFFNGFFCVTDAETVFYYFLSLGNGAQRKFMSLWDILDQSYLFSCNIQGLSFI